MNKAAPKQRLVTPGLRRLVFCLMAFCCAPQLPAQLVTNIAQLHRIADSSRRYLCPIQFEADVLWSTPASLVLHDDSGDGIFAVDLKGQLFAPGTRLKLDAVCTVDGPSLSLNPTCVVDNDGCHAAEERSGFIFLTAGRFPLRAMVFNGTNQFLLDVLMEGPGLSRQKVPLTALFRKVDVDGRTVWTNGLDYACYEGQWDRLPEFRSLTPKATGSVSDFDLSVATVPEFVGLEFNGYIDIPRPGLYTFYTLSDDGSRLEIDSVPPQLTVIGTNRVPVPRRVTPGQIQDGAEDAQWAEVEGTVVFAAEHASGLTIELSSGVGRMRVEVVDSSSIAPDMLGKSRLRARGICHSTCTAGGNWIAGSLIVRDGSQIQFLGLSEQLWANYPVLTIAQALVLDPDDWVDASDLARFHGRLSKEGSTVFLADGSGRLRVETSQALPASSDLVVEVLGRLVQGSNAVLQSACWRPLTENTDDSAKSNMVFTAVEQVKGMKREDAMRGFPVKLSGIITLSQGMSGVIQDATGGIYYQCDQDPGAAVGDYCSLEGISAPGDFAPIVIHCQMVRIGQGVLPEPLRPTWDQLMNGSLDTQYVEVQGVVTAASEAAVTLLTRGGRVNLGIDGRTERDLKPYESALVRVRGVLFARWDGETHRVKYGEMVVQAATIAVEEPAYANPFTLAVKHVPELHLYDPTASRLKMVKLAGQVVHQDKGEFFLLDGTNGFRAIPKEPGKLAIGDLIETVGYPDLSAPSPVLHEALVRKTGYARLPEPDILAETNLFSAANDARLVQVEARLLNLSSNRTEQLLDLQTGSRIFSARLKSRTGLAEPLASGSTVKIKGVFAAHGGDRNLGLEVDSFEILLNSPDDIVIVSTPPWWTMKHTLATLAVLLTFGLLAAQWITQLRRRVDQKTAQLREEIEKHKRTEFQLQEKTNALEQEIEERKQIAAQLIDKKVLLEKEIEERKKIENEKEQIHKELLTASRQAGMAEVATGVLHNVGNVLNSINVSTTFLSERAQNSKCNNLGRVSAMLDENSASLVHFLTEDERGRKLPGYLKLLSETVSSEQREIQKELRSLADNVNHIKDIIAMQQSYAKLSSVVEKVAPRDLLEAAFKMHVGGYLRHEVQLKREFDEVPEITTDRHKVLQVLVNLFQNAKYACEESGRKDKLVTVRIRQGEGTVRIEVADNGIGIPPENLTKIFRHGFTTRKNGHGFGLHSGALAAKELGGALIVTSEGTGKGATFILELPLDSKVETPRN